MEQVDYMDTFIAVADDSTATRGIAPPANDANPSVAARAFRMITEHPYGFTSGDVIFAAFADRRGVPEQERASARKAFYARGQACLRTSNLGRRYGWGIHADADGRIALVGVETPEYAEFASGRRRSVSGAPIKVAKAMRSSRSSR